MSSTADQAGGLYFEEKGRGAPILLIPAAGATASTWGAPLLDELTRAGRVITYDRRGYGQSVGGTVDSLATHTGDAAALLDRLGVREVVVAGISMGGAIAIDLARQRPDLVSAVVAHEPAWPTGQPPPPSAVAALSKTAWYFFRRRDSQAVEAFLQWAYSYRDGGSAWDRFPAAWRQTAIDNAQAVRADFGLRLGRYPGARELASISLPVVLCCGGRSAPMLETMTRRVARMVPAAVVRHIDRAGHAVAFDAPAEFAKVILDASSACSGTESADPVDQL